MPERDFRVRAFLFIENEDRALGLYDHVEDVKDEAVDINLDQPNAEMRMLEIGDAWIVEYDLAFPPDKQGAAIGLFNHTKNIPATPSPEGFADGFVSLENCGHRVNQSCELIERYEVV